jgi:GntR family histidine utilization transcriptional repressor
MNKPQFVIIKESLIKQIEAKALRPGDRVLSENQLSEQFSVSRMTARRALTELVEAGILERTKGLGTFVADLRPMSSMMEIHNIAEEVEMRAQQYSCEVISLNSIKAKKTEANFLGYSEGDEVFHSIIVHKENGLPIQYEERYVSPRLIPLYDRQDFTLATPNCYLREVAPLTEADHIVEAVNVNKVIAKHLSISQQEPCLKITRRSSSSGGVVSLAYLIHPGSRYRLGSHLEF